MSETITLPRSGVVLTGNSCGDFEFQTKNDAIWLTLHIFRDGCVAKISATRAPMHKGTRDECIAWLDLFVLETRAALLPADARERVARELFTFNRMDDWGAANDDERTEYLDGADAVLSALGIGGGA